VYIQSDTGVGHTYATEGLKKLSENTKFQMLLKLTIENEQLSHEVKARNKVRTHVHGDATDVIPPKPTRDDINFMRAETETRASAESILDKLTGICDEAKKMIANAKNINRDVEITQTRSVNIDIPKETIHTESTKRKFDEPIQETEPNMTRDNIMIRLNMTTHVHSGTERKKLKTIVSSVPTAKIKDMLSNNFDITSPNTVHFGINKES